MLSSVISGPIDVDKLDYLVRDSQMCYLTYGNLIDYDRLVRNLTIIIQESDGGNADVEIGVYERGQSAAESITFARYLLFQAVYFHHTARAARCMLRRVLKPMLKSKDRHKKLVAEIEKLLAINGKTVNPISVEAVYSILVKHTDDVGKDIIGLLRQRRYFKRILTVHRKKPLEDEKDNILDLLRNKIDDAAFHVDFQKDIRIAYNQLKSAPESATISSYAHQKHDNTIEALTKDGMVLLDFAKMPPGSDKSLRIIPEPKRLQHNYLERSVTSSEISGVWTTVHHRLMRLVCKGRVYCHPDLADSLMTVLGPKTIRDILEKRLFSK